MKKYNHILILLFLMSLLIPTGSVLAFFENAEDIKLVIGDVEQNVSYEEFSKWAVINPVIVSSHEPIAEIENIHHCSTDPILCKLTKTHQKATSIQVRFTIVVNNENVYSFVEDLGRKVNKDPVDAKFSVENGKVTAFSFDKDGIKLNVDASAKILIEKISKNNASDTESARKINLVYEVVKPEIRSGSIDTLGINTLIGEGKSNFRGSPRSRIHNISVATSRFDGILIKPGEEFSFVDILGPVDGEHGYKEELVIKKDKTEPEFGGGICQVSTTAFRAAIYSGMKITARRNHAYPVSYYNPQGMDATVYIPRPDLRFTNNTPGYVLIQTKIEGNDLVFQFYGTDDGRKTEVIGPTILERNPDNSMKTTFTQKVYDKDNNLTLNDVFNSSYDSPDKYPHPGEEKLTEKPKDWSDKEWKKYKKEHGI